jgi:pyruvate dehydrogenase E1 component alpha subunit
MTPQETVCRSFPPTLEQNTAETHHFSIICLGEVVCVVASETLLPSATPVRFVAEDGTPADRRGAYAAPADGLLKEAYRLMVLGRRFDVQATALTKQGRLAVCPSSAGQEACQVAAALVLETQDWLFPTYRDSVALVARGLKPGEVLTLLRGDAHCGYNPAETRVAPQCTPLATQTLHAAGLAHAMQRRGEDAVALALIGDGATSEGDFHEALNFAAVFKAPVVFFVQNNRFAISVPFEKQSAAAALAYKGIGYGMRSEQVDGNDAVAVLAVLGDAVRHAREGHGPVLVEAHTYRIDAHTNADDATRYRDAEEVAKWREADPLKRLETYLKADNLLQDNEIQQFAADAEVFAQSVRDTLNAEAELDPLSLFDHVYAEPTRQLRAQRAALAAELEA